MRAFHLTIYENISFCNKFKLSLIKALFINKFFIPIDHCRTDQYEKITKLKIAINPHQKYLEGALEYPILKLILDNNVRN